MQLRNYQAQGFSEIESSLRLFRKILYVSPTGSGKTVIFSTLVSEYHTALPILVVLKRKSLINQTSKVMNRFKIKHKVIQANHWKSNEEADVALCSIDTLAARDSFPFGDREPLIVVDESADVKTTGKKYMNFLNKYPTSKIIGFTASPYGDNSFFETVVCPIEAYELRDQGYLVPIDTFIPSVMNVSGVRIQNGDYNNKQLFEAVGTSAITGDIVQSWKKFANNKPTILFAVNVAHSKMIAEKFITEGIPAVHADASTEIIDREKIVEDFKSGKVKVICNCDIFSTGLDLPEIEVIQLCRPTKSLIWFIQAVGRSTRPSPGKTKSIVIDNAGATLNFGPFYLPRQISLEPPHKKTIQSEINIKVCSNCYYTHDQEICPNCGFVPEKKARKIFYNEGELTPYEVDNDEIKKAHFIKKYHSLIWVKKNKRIFVPSWEYQSLLKDFGKDTCRKFAKEVNFPCFLLKD